MQNCPFCIAGNPDKLFRQVSVLELDTYGIPQWPSPGGFSHRLILFKVGYKNEQIQAITSL